MNNSLFLFLYIYLMINIIESTGDVFDFRPSKIGYMLHGFFEVPADNFAGNQFWLCFNYQAADYGTPGRYRRSSVGIDEDADTFEDSIPQWPKNSIEKYPSVDCGGKARHQGPNSHWFALNGLWLTQSVLQLDFVNLQKNGKPLSVSRNVTFPSSNTNADDINDALPFELQQHMRLHWKFSVKSETTSTSSVRLENMDPFEVPAMKPDTQVQIRLNGFGARIESLLANINTIVINYLTYLRL